MYKPGQTGNPGGRPSIPEELKSHLRTGFVDAVAFWLKTLKDPKASWLHRNKAAEMIANYAYGKPKEIIELEHIGEPIESYEDTLKKIDELLARRSAKTSTSS